MIEDKLGYNFKDKKLLEAALTHSSITNTVNYERLEFLGDRVLGLVMAEALFDIFSEEKEGGLAKRHASLVQGSTIAVIAAQHNLGEDIILSDSEKEAGGQENDNILADVMEALLGAIYLDGGLENVKKIILTLWGDRIHTMDHAPLDPKTELQEWAQARSLPLPEYKIVAKEGPDHAPIFDIEVQVKGVTPVIAQGSSRRQAEKEAAAKMLSEIKEDA